MFYRSQTLYGAFGVTDESVKRRKLHNTKFFLHFTDTILQGEGNKTKASSVSKKKIESLLCLQLFSLIECNSMFSLVFSTVLYNAIFFIGSLSSSKAFGFRHGFLKVLAITKFKLVAITNYQLYLQYLDVSQIV